MPGRQSLDQTKLYWGLTAAAVLSVLYLAKVGIPRYDVLWYPKCYEDAFIVFLDALCCGALGLWLVSGHGLPREIEGAEEAGTHPPSKPRLLVGSLLLCLAAVLAVATTLTLLSRGRGDYRFNPIVWSASLCLGAYLLTGVILQIAGISRKSRLMRFFYGPWRGPWDRWRPKRRKQRKMNR